MTHRITVRSIVADAHAAGILKHLKSIFPELALKSIACTSVYTIDGNLLAGELKFASERLTNPLTEQCALYTVLAPTAYSLAIEIGFLPGVTDNVGHTVRQTIEDSTSYRFKNSEAVYSSRIYFLTGEISDIEAARIAGELHNPLIERASVYPAGTTDFPLIVPKVSLGVAPEPIEVDLDINDEELERIGKSGIVGPEGARGPLALSLEELKAIRAYFQKEKRKPTDVELEALAQTWSEHCQHTIFNDPLDEIKEGIYRKYIKGATEKIRKQKGKRDFCVSVFKDNSGAIAFDENYLVTHKVETHNSPSGLDPFGGAVTGIVGVNRDCLGFGLGAKPIANVYGFFVADPHDERQLFRDKEKKQPLLPARRILEGVIKGINAGGNQSGIPTPLGFVAVDPSYRGKPLVFGGTVGLIPRKVKGRKMYEKKAKSGDYIVMLGGRVGADGIHGATFSSESLSSGSPATAVQIGDPITQKKFSDALIREARDKGLYNSITDDGAGGLSGSIGEMAREAGGCVVELESVPLKYPGLSPWQIWISESQERMTLAVPKAKWTAFKKICARHDVEATVIGTFTKSGRVVVKHGGNEVMNVSLKFLHDGRPVRKQKSQMSLQVGNKEQRTNTKKTDLKQALLQMLASASIGSTAFIARQYDHTVLAQATTYPLHGKGSVGADAAVLRPLAHSQKGIVLSQGYCPWYAEIDTYAMAAAAIDTAVRNAVCVGAHVDYLAILDNFCWSSSEKPERLYELKQAAKACYDTAVAFGTPFISGKDSMFNDFRGYSEDGERVHIAALPTLLISAIGVMPDIARAQTIDFKMPGDALFLLGETNDELGASAYFAATGRAGGEVAFVNAKKNMSIYRALSKAIDAGLVSSAIPLSRGGLAVAIAKAAIAGQLGAVVDISDIASKATSIESKLFSESQGRVVVSVRPEVAADFERACKGIPLSRIGEVSGKTSLSIKNADERVAAHLDDLTDAYRSFFKEW